jgi:alpha-beta hydrolase superfamily lysophospholipase
MRLDSGGTAFRLGTAANMLDAIIELKAKAIPGFTTPFCLIHGTEDEGCPISGAKFMHETAASKDKEFHPLEGMYHALYADRDSDRPMKIAVDWVEKRLGSKQ